MRHTFKLALGRQSASSIGLLNKDSLSSLEPRTTLLEKNRD